MYLASFGREALADEINKDGLTRRGNLDTDTQGEYRVRIQVEMGVMPL